MKVQLLGANELIAKFRALDEAVATSHIDAAVQAGVDYMAGQIRDKAPARTGELRSEIATKNIEASRDRNSKGITVGHAFYWRFVEFGHRIVGHKPKKRDTGNKVAAVSFIRKTFKNRKTTARQVIRDTFRDRMHGFLD